jgi:hypothetical protein
MSLPIVTVRHAMIGNFQREAMAPKVRSKGTRVPRVKGGEDGYVFAGEAARILRCADLTYLQLRRIFDLASPRSPRVTTGRTRRGRTKGRGTPWARFRFEHLVSARIALSVLRAAPRRPSGRLPIAQLEQVCARLRRPPYRLESPLLDAKLLWLGSSLVAEVRGEFVEPARGQQLLTSVTRAAAGYLRPRGRKSSMGIGGVRSSRGQTSGVSAFVSPLSTARAKGGR